MSIRYKIAFFFAMLVTLFVTIVSVSVYFISAAERAERFTRRLKNRAISSGNVYSGITDSNLSVLRRMDTNSVAALYNKSIIIADGNNKIEYSFSDVAGDTLGLSADVIQQVNLLKEYYFNYRNKKAVAIMQSSNKGIFITAVAAVDIDGTEYLAELKKTMLSSLILAAIFSYLAGLFFATRLILPLKRMTADVNLITSNNLSQHVKIGSVKDELSVLAQTFNNLLDRLQESFVIQRNFISNASHELSTPLTSISSQLEVAMQRQRSPDEYREVMQSIYEDIRGLQQLTHSLLDIAKTGSQGNIDLTEVRLDEVLLKVTSDIQRQNAPYKVVLNFDGFPDDERLVTAFGSINLLYIALKNLIENGCKYADNQTSVVTASAHQHTIIIKVSNSGDIIAEADIQNIFQPFFRTASAQQKHGFGLGLTLTKRILALHKSTIQVSSHLEEGTTFTITIPNITTKV